MRHRPVPPYESGLSPRSQKITPYNSKKSVPSIPHFQNVYDEHKPDNSDLLIISPIPLNRRYSKSPRAAPGIVRPTIMPTHPSYSKNLKKGKEKNADKNFIRESIYDIKDHPACQQYSAEIQEIEDLLRKLIAKHPDNEEYYKMHYSAFLRIMNEAANKNYAKMPVIIRNTKMFFEGLLNGQIGRRGKIERPNFDFEQKLRTIINKPSKPPTSSPRHNHNLSTSFNKGKIENDDEDENVFQELFEENDNLNRSSNHSGRLDSKRFKFSIRKDSDLESIDLSNLKMYEAEIQEIKDLMHKLINKHPENEDYYRKHYETFLRVLNEAVNTNPGKAPDVIHNTKLFFEGLLNGLIGSNGKFVRTNFDFEQKLRSIITKPESDKSTKNVFQDIFNENKLSNLKMYEKQIKEIEDLMNKLIKKYPKNEDYYRKIYDTFINVLNDAVKTNSPNAANIIQSTKSFFEGLLNGSIGNNGRVDDKDFDFEKRLRSLLSKSNGNKNIFQDLFDKNKLKKYDSEIKKIKKLVDQLVDKHPENSDYYQHQYDTFIRVLTDAVNNDSSRAPEIINNARTFFEGLLNDTIGTNGIIDDPEFDFEQRLRSILNNSNDDDSNKNVFQDLIDKNKLKMYEEEIEEINNIVNQLIDKHPENEDYYRNQYDQFMRVLKDAIDTDSSKAPAIIHNARVFFNGLLNDKIGKNGILDDPDFDLEQRLRSILSNSNDDNSNENIFQDLFDKNKLKKYDSEIKKIKKLVDQLVDKHPENSDYYQHQYDTFIRVLTDAVNNDSSRAPEIINNARIFFEGLLNDTIGTNGILDDPEFDFEQRLRSILNNSNDDDSNENVFQDLFNKNKLKDYESDIKEIDNLVNKLIDKHPENEDYYRQQQQEFLRVLNDAVNTDSSKVPEVIKNAKLFFNGLLNDEIGKDGKIDDPNFDFGQKLQSILNDDKSNENVFQDLFDKNKLKDYESDIEEIKNLVDQLIEKHPENEDHYRKRYDEFLKVLTDAVNTDSSKAPEIINNAKTFFNGLLSDKIGTNGILDDPEFDFEKRLQSILSDSNDDKSNENVFQDLFDKNKLKDYESDIAEVDNLVNQLIDKHPENEDYYRQRHQEFMKALNDAANTDIEKVPEVIKNAKLFFNGLLNDEIGTNGVLDDPNFDFSQRLQSIISDSNDDKSNENAFQDLFTKNKLKDYESDIQEINNLVNQLIDKHPENEDYYRQRHQEFMKALNDAANTDIEKVPEVIKNAKLFFNGLLNDEIGTNGILDDPNFDFSQRLQSIISDSNDDKSNENVFQDLFTKNNLKDYEPEIAEVDNLVNQLIDKHPENEDYYRKLHQEFMKALNDAANTDIKKVPYIINNAKLFFNGLLNDEIGTNGILDDPNFDFGQRLQSIISNSKDDNSNENIFMDLFNQKYLANLKMYASEIQEIEQLIEQLIEKHPENEYYYRRHYHTFLKVLNEAVVTESGRAQSIINNTKIFLQGLLNDDIGTNGRLETSKFNFENKLRSILKNPNYDDSNGTTFHNLLYDIYLSNLKMYESEIKEIEQLIEQLIEKHPYNENYYRKHFYTFLKVLNEAVVTKSGKDQQIINNTRAFFQGLLNNKIGQNGKYDDSKFNFEQKLRKGDFNIPELAEDPEIDENLKIYESEISQIRRLLKQLIKKYPENEEYYQKLYDAFIRIAREAAAANSSATPQIIHVTKLFFEELLNGDHAKLGFDIEDKLRDLFSFADGTTTNNNKDDNSSLKKYEPEIGEVKEILQQLIDKHPENEDYYRKLFEAFMRVIREAAESNNPAASDIARAAKLYLNELLNGEKDKLDFDMEEKLREILSNGEEIKDIENILEQLIEKHPENEDYYRKLFDAFMRVIREAAESNSPAAPELARVTKFYFNKLLNGEQDKLDFDMEERLREILANPEDIYKPYDQIKDENDQSDGLGEMTDEMILREAEKVSTTRNPRFSNFQKLYPPARATTISKKSQTVPNYQTVINAIRFTCLPGPRFTSTVDQIIETMKDSKEERFVLLLASRTLKFKGVYILAQDSLSANKLWGQGPNVVKNEDCSGFYKYLNGQKQFDPLEIKGFTPTTDGFALKKKLEPDSW